MNHAVPGARPRRRSQRGALLLDALIALALVTVMIAACLALSMSALAAQESARQQNTATNAARKVVENLRAFKGAAVAPGAYPDASAFGAVPQLDLLTAGSAALSVSNVRGTLKRAVVTVRWQSGMPRRPQTLALTTYLAREGFSR